MLVARVLYRSSFSAFYGTDLNCSSNTLLTLRTLLTCFTLVTFRSNKNSCSSSLYSNNAISYFSNKIQKSRRSKYIIIYIDIRRSNSCGCNRMSICIRFCVRNMKHRSTITFVSFFSLDTLITFVSLRKYDIKNSISISSRICN